MSVEHVSSKGIRCSSCNREGDGRTDWVHLYTRFSMFSDELQHSYWCPTCWAVRNRRYTKGEE